MLGEQFGEEQGKITTYRVVSIEGPKVEVSFRSTGKIVGAEYRGFGTYWSIPKPGGHLQGEGQGVLMTADGDMASWSGNGIGKFKPGGGLSWRGVLYYSTASQKLAKLNGTTVVFEHESDANDNITSKIWEWK